MTQAPSGEYQSIVTVAVMTRGEVGLTPRVDTQISTLAFTVTGGNHAL